MSCSSGIIASYPLKRPSGVPSNAVNIPITPTLWAAVGDAGTAFFSGKYPFQTCTVNVPDIGSTGNIGLRLISRQWSDGFLGTIYVEYEYRLRDEFSPPYTSTTSISVGKSPSNPTSSSVQSSLTQRNTVKAFTKVINVASLDRISIYGYTSRYASNRIKANYVWVVYA